jgi:outer membrane cobalamin receptor
MGCNFVKKSTMNHFLIFLLLFATSGLSAQTTISGKVQDNKGKPIEGANVFLEGTYDGSISREDGSFSFQTNEVGLKKLVISYVSFETISIEMNVYKMQDLTLIMREDVSALDAVMITAGTFEAGDKARNSVLKPLDIVTTAGAAGDIVAALQTLPGTQTVGESGRLFVRGGEAGETQTFIDGIRVAQPYGASVQNIPTRGRFSPFLFSGMSFSTGGYSAEYGDALSSVLLLNTKDEADQNQTEISLMTVGLGLGHTIKGDNNDLTINAAYINLKPYQAIVPELIDWNKPYQALSGEGVYTHRYAKGILKGYAAFDVSEFDLNRESMQQENTQRIDLKNNNFYANTSYKSYWNNNWQFFNGLSYGFGTNEINIDHANVKNDEHSLHIKSKVSRRFSNRFRVSSGADVFYTRFDENFTEADFNLNSGYESVIAAFYTEADVFFSKNFAAKVGVRLNYNELLDELRLSPRVSLAYKTGEHSQFALAYGMFSQAPQQDYLKFNTDLNTEKAAHYILNYQYSHNRRTLRVEGYYKDYSDLVQFDSEIPVFNSAFSNGGSGYATGLDVFWRDSKTIRNTEYWLSYSYIDTERLYKNFPVQATPNFVANHTASIVVKRWIQDWRSQLGLSHTFHTGRPFDNPNQPGFMTGKTRDYHSMGFNWAYLISPQKILYFSVSNVLGNQNVFGYDYAQTPGENGAFNRRAITPTADRFFFIGFFWTLSDDKNSNQLKNL